MAWIRQIEPRGAAGALKRNFDAAMKRAGRVWNILRVMSLSPETLRSSMGLYRAVMFGDSPLSRGQRELLAVVVSKTNRCRY